MMRRRAASSIYEALGYGFCEATFRMDCRGPFGCLYRAGCRLYGKVTR